MSGLRRKDLPFAAISLGFSAAAVELLWPVISHTSNVPWLIALLATLALVAPCYHVLRVFTNSVLAPWSPHQRAMLVLGSTGFAALLLLAWPLSPLPSGKHTVSVTNLGARDPSGRGAEVWVEKFSPSDTAPASLEGWTWSSSWRMSGGELVSVDATSQAAKWEGLTDGTAVLTLTRHPWSGGAAISWDGAPPTVVNLYSPVTYRIRIHQPPPFFPHAAWWLAHLVWLSLCLSALVGWLGHRRRSEVRVWTPPVWPLLASITACLLIYWLALYPGPMTADSIEQWTQVETGSFSDVHPAIHTLTYWLITRVWHSPGAIGLIHIFVFAALLMLFLRELARMGATRWSIIGTAALAIGWPIFGVNLVTLWKDIPFTFGLFGLSYCLLRVVNSRGAWIRSWQGLLAMTLASIVVALYRHNGILVIVVTGAVLLTIRPLPRRRLLASTVAAMIAFVMVKGPLYKLIGVQPADWTFKLQNQIHQMGAMLADGAVLTPPQEALLDDIMPVQRWRDGYSCYTAGSIIYDPQFHWSEFDNKAKDFVRMFLSLAKSHLRALVTRQVCISSFLWRITPAEDSYLATWALGIDPSPLGIQQTSLLPHIQRALAAFGAWSTQPGTIIWFWRPALYLFAGLFLVGIGTIRAREPLLLLIMLPTVANTVVLMLLTPSQSVRYQLGAFFLFLISPCVASIKGSSVHNRRGDEAFVDASTSPNLL